MLILADPHGVQRVKCYMYLYIVGIGNYSGELNLKLIIIPATGLRVILLSRSSVLASWNVKFSSVMLKFKHTLLSQISKETSDVNTLESST